MSQHSREKRERAKRRREESGVPPLPLDWPEIRDSVMLRDKRVCQVRHDGCSFVATDVHHIVARIDQGDESLDNLCAICGPCHDRETAKTVQQRTAKRQTARRERQRRDHPGRKDRHDS